MDSRQMDIALDKYLTHSPWEDEADADEVEPDVICPDCKGKGEFETIDGFDVCTRCAGEGVIHEEAR